MKNLFFVFTKPSSIFIFHNWHDSVGSSSDAVDNARDIYYENLDTLKKNTSDELNNLKDSAGIKLNSELLSIQLARHFGEAGLNGNWSKQANQKTFALLNILQNKVGINVDKTSAYAGKTLILKDGKWDLVNAFTPREIPDNKPVVVEPKKVKPREIPDNKPVVVEPKEIKPRETLDNKPVVVEPKEVRPKNIPDNKPVINPKNIEIIDFIQPTIEGEIGSQEKNTKVTFRNPVARVSFLGSAPTPSEGEIVVSAPYLSNNQKTQEWTNSNGIWEFNRDPEKDSEKGKNGLVIIDKNGELHFSHIEVIQTSESISERPHILGGEKINEDNIAQAFTTIGIKINGKFINENFKKAYNGEIEKDSTTLTHYLGRKRNGEITIFCLEDGDGITREEAIKEMREYTDVVTLDYFSGKANGIQYNDGKRIIGEKFDKSGGYLILKEKKYQTYLATNRI